MLYLVIEKFKNGDPKPVYERFAAQGRLAPDGLHYIDSWVTQDLSTCYQIMQTDDPTLLGQWIANWQDLVDFQVVEVISSAQAKQAALNVHS